MEYVAFIFSGFWIFVGHLVAFFLLLCFLEGAISNLVYLVFVLRFPKEAAEQKAKRKRSKNQLLSLTILTTLAMIIVEVARKADDGNGRLKVMIDDDGDAHVAVLRDDVYYSTEFCTLQGGGRSPKVRRALHALARAIQEDNERDPYGATY